MKNNSSKVKFYFLVFLVLIIVLGPILLRLSGCNFYLYKSLKQISHTPLFPLVFISLYLISSFFPIPFLSFLGAAIFPFYKAFLLSMLGNIISSIILFYFTRWLGRDYIQEYKKSHPIVKKLNSKFEENSFLYIFILRIFFIIPVELVIVLAGISNVKFKNYLLASILGTIPVVLLSIFLVKSFIFKQFYLFVISLVIFSLFLILPLIFLKELKSYFKK